MHNHTIRKTRSEDLPELGQVVEQTGLFPADLLAPMAGPALCGQVPALWLSGLTNGKVTGFCYAAPEEMADGVWNMRALAVVPGQHRGELGRRIVTELETRLRAMQTRLVIVDTSGRSDFAGARRFYKQIGYKPVARLRDFWAEGDDKVTFCKRL